MAIYNNYQPRKNKLYGEFLRFFQRLLPQLFPFGWRSFETSMFFRHAVKEGYGVVEERFMAGNHGLRHCLTVTGLGSSAPGFDDGQVWLHEIKRNAFIEGPFAKSLACFRVHRLMPPFWGYKNLSQLSVRGERMQRLRPVSMILASALLTCVHEFVHMYRADSLKDNRVYIVVVMGVMEILKTFGADESFPAQRLF
jgi:hypothetical protein